MAARGGVNSQPGAKKARLGQNFLADHSAAERIVASLGDISHALVLEIGPGRGAITDLLARSAARLIAIELDRMLAVALRMRYARQPNVEIVEGDVLTFDFQTLVSGELRGLRDRHAQQRPEKARVIGNLPYYITSDILLRLFEFHEHFESIVIMVQKEVADRLAARPGTRDYGLLTVTAQLFVRIEKLFTLPPGAFIPPPKVYSTVLRLTVAPRSAELGVETRPFIAFLKQSFGQKRKTLANNLKLVYPAERVSEALRATGARADVRAEALSLEKLAQIFKRVAYPS